jgi:N-acetylmuramoyl-L-alanine amidase
VEVVVAERHPRIDGASVGLAIGLAFASTGADAAVVRDLRAIAASSATRVIVEVEGDFTWRTHASPDGGTVFVDIANATVADDAPRMLPVSDKRVDGVILEDDGASRAVRIAVDIAGKVAPRLDASADSSRLILTFVDGSADGVPTSSGSARGSENSRSTLRRDPPPPGSPGPASREVDRAARANARTGPAAIEARGGGHGSEAAASPTPPATSRRSVVERPLVVLDPGHGGKDPGATAWTGEYEKDIVLDLADRIARRLRDSGEVDVAMTRSGDEYVALADRRDFSRRWNAAAFVSIHANASHSGSARGFATYYHPRTTGAGKKGGDREARRLARLENGGVKPHSAARGALNRTAARGALNRTAARGALNRSAAGGAASRPRTDSATTRRASLASEAAPVLDRRSESMRLARLVQDELVRRLEMRYEAVRDLGAREGPFFVIGENAAPSVLVEAAFLTHREEGVRMRSEVYREQIADGVARGILAFLEQQRHSGTL